MVNVFLSQMLLSLPLPEQTFCRVNVPPRPWMPWIAECSVQVGQQLEGSSVLQGLSKVPLALAEWVPARGFFVGQTARLHRHWCPNRYEMGHTTWLPRKTCNDHSTSFGCSVFEFYSAEPLPCPRPAQGAEAKTGRRHHLMFSSAE